MELKEQLESVCSIKASIIAAGSTKKSTESDNMLARDRDTVYQHDPRHVESLGLENGNTVQTPTIDDVPEWLHPEQGACSSVKTDRT